MADTKFVPLVPPSQIYKPMDWIPTYGLYIYIHKMLVVLQVILLYLFLPVFGFPAVKVPLFRFTPLFECIRPPAE